MLKILAITLTAILLTACAPSLDDEPFDLFYDEMFVGDEPLHIPDLMAEPVNYVPAIPVEGGVLTMAMHMPATLNPLLNEDPSVARILRLVYEPLIGLNAEHRPTSYLLYNFEISEDGRVALLTLHDNIYWEDGQQIMASDIVFSLNTIRNSGENSIYRHVLEGVSNYYLMSGGLTVAIVYDQPNYSFAYRLNFPVIPQHHHAGTGQLNPSASQNMSPLGNGAFRVTNYRPAQDLVLLPSNRSLRPRPNIGRITVLIIPDLETKMHAFNERIIDVIDSDVATWGRHRSTNTPNITSYANNHFEFIGFNFNNHALTDISLRRAIAHAVNVEEMISTIFINQAIRANTPVNPVAWFFEPGTVTYPHSQELARRMLEDAGYSHFSSRGFIGASHNGIVSELHLRILVNNENAERVNIANMLNDSLRMQQISTEIIMLDFDDYMAALRNGDFDLFIGGVNIPVYGDISFMFSSDATPQSGGLNFFRYNSHIMDSLITQVSDSTTQAEFARSIAHLQEYFAYELPVVSLVYRKSALLSSDGIAGDKRPTITNAFDNIHLWFIDR